MQLTTLFDLASRLRIDGALPLFLLYTFMPVYLTAHTMLPVGVIVHINKFVGVFFVAYFTRHKEI